MVFRLIRCTNECVVKLFNKKREGQPWPWQWPWMQDSSESVFLFKKAFRGKTIWYIPDNCYILKKLYLPRIFINMIRLVGKRFGIEIHLLLRRWIYIATTSVIDTLIHANAVLMTEKFSVLFWRRTFNNIMFFVTNSRLKNV